jgi:hypothetical protein
MQETGGLEGRKRTSTSLSLVISPVDAWPAGVGRSETQCSPRPGPWEDAAAASFSGARVARSVSDMVAQRLVGDGRRSIS